MNFDLKKPCKDCPFRTDNNFILNVDRVDEICHSITAGDQSFTCHKTSHFDEDGQPYPHKKEQHCAGALIMLEKMDDPNQMMRVAERCGFYDRTKLDMDSPVFDNDDEMLQEYEHRNDERKTA